MEDKLRQEYQEKFQKALLAIRKLKADLAEAKQSSDEPIAIIGMGCRFPGGINSPETYWNFLAEGGNAVSEIKRWNLDKLFDEDYTTPGKIATKQAALIDDVELFDNTFFNIPPMEATYTDPQQRLLLQVACEALENAGQDLYNLKGSNTGVFIGIAGQDYKSKFLEKPAFENVNAYMATGGEMYSAAGRISYSLGLEGPSILSNTACSSSLVALHLACQSLRTGESDMAISGGANLILSPETFIALSNANALSPDGKCRTFDAGANGYVRAEGVGSVVLKRLSDAIKDKDPVLAVIKSTMINQDGQSNGFTAPNGKAQEKMLRKALEKAGLTAADIDLIEAHGTGTPLGDPIELSALEAVLAEGHSKENPLYIGSVKTNFGHAEGASGIAGLIKLVLSLQHKQIPAHLHFEKPNPYFDWEDVPFKIATQLTEWKTDGKARTAGVSGFGISGTNAHAIVSEYIQEDVPVTEIPQRDAHLLALSAKSEVALKDYAKKYIDLLKSEKASAQILLQQLCAQAAHKKTHFEHRVTVAAETIDDMIAQLKVLASADQPLNTIAAEEGKEYKVAFVFPGQGSQWAGMGHQLMATERVFREKIEACEQAFLPFVDWSLSKELQKSEEQSRLSEIDIIQPALFAIEVALCELWRSWGITPQAVIGHSMGEVAAAHAAGILSLEDAANIICSRSKLMKTVSGKGAMAVIELNVKAAEELIKGLENQVAIAVNNSEQSTVISGDPATVQQLVDQLDEQGLFARMIKVDVASHSPHMDPLMQPLKQQLQSIKTEAGHTEFYSTVQVRLMNGKELDAGYWVSNLRGAVLFGNTIAQLLEEGFTHFIEMSPHPVLKMAVEQVANSQQQEVKTIASFHKNSQEATDMLRQWGNLYASGYPVDWKVIYDEPKRLINLPTYPWQQSRFWIDSSWEQKQEAPSASQSQQEKEKPAVQNTFKTELLQLKNGARYTAITSYIKQELSNISGYPIAQLAEKVNYAKLGLDSMMAMRFRKVVEKSLGLKLTTKIFWQCATIEKLSEHFLNQLGDKPTSELATETPQEITTNDWLIKSKPNPEARMKLFTFHDAAGNASLFSRWPEKLHEDIEVIAVQLPGRATRMEEELFTDMDELIDALLPHLEKECDRPFAFFGHSMGGMVAYNAAKALEEKEMKAEKLIISACHAPTDYRFENEWYNLPEQELLRLFPAFTKQNIDEEELRQSLIKALRSDLQLVQSYKHQSSKPLDIPIIGLHAENDHLITKEQVSHWAKLSNQSFNQYKCPGGHAYLYNNTDYVSIIINHELASVTKEELLKILI